MGEMRWVSIFLAALGCSTSSTSSTPTSITDAAADGPTTCELRGVVAICERTSGSGGCCAQNAFPYDEALGCVRYGTAYPIGCVANEGKGLCTELGVVGCAITREGETRKVWFTPSRVSGWASAEPCGGMLEEQVTRGTACK